VFQRCVDNLKGFFSTKEGKIWLDDSQIYPPFLSKSFIDFKSSETMMAAIKNNVNNQSKKY
jgi:hypothetical protein